MVFGIGLGISLGKCILYPENENYKKVENYKFKKYKFLKANVKMEIIIKLGDIEIEEQKFHVHKEQISMKNIDVNKITVSNKVSFHKKRF